jgi:hypothetical protein
VQLLLADGGFSGWLDRWAPLAEWVVAIATGGLAVGTFVLAKRAHQEAKAVGESTTAVKHQVELEAEQLVAAQRPLMLPLMGLDIQGVPHLELKNAGAGPAMNVRGFLWWTETPGGAAQLHPQVLAAGDGAYVQVVAVGAAPNWTNAVGFLRYHDLTGTEWQTHFRCRVDGAGNRRIELIAVGRTKEFGDPAYNAEQGWVNKPDSVGLWRVAV